MRRTRTGLTLIELLVVVTIIGMLMALLLPAVQSAREAGRRMQCANNLKQIGLALANYQSAYTVYPFGCGADSDRPGRPTYTSPGNRRYSLHSQILPYLELNEVYELIDFTYPPFYPDTTGDPKTVTGRGPNEDAAQMTIPVFLCPSDHKGQNRPWGPNNYRSCNGSNWSGRKGDGLFGQGTAIRPADVRDGLSYTAAFCERVLGDDDKEAVDMEGDLFSLPAPWTEETFRRWCAQLGPLEAASLYHDANGGMTWLEGNMNWTRYNHMLPPGLPSCKNGITWNGVAMTANSRHYGGVNLLLGDGSVRFVSNQVEPSVWRALGTIAGRETISDKSY
ncbi:MAG TPA: DUF1559 domain-containing protein [Planctomycetaceae bacterium]|nr:DUF1559 domain-containing protein [Planctomycetaceae bacterium]HIQ21814.1 DUF1559 domain-containing protein [Planctomycetota bacterium]